jgi:hypothetical protein
MEVPEWHQIQKDNKFHIVLQTHEVISPVEKWSLPSSYHTEPSSLNYAYLWSNYAKHLVHWSNFNPNDHAEVLGPKYLPRSRTTIPRTHPGRPPRPPSLFCACPTDFGRWEMVREKKGEEWMMGGPNTNRRGPLTLSIDPQSSQVCSQFGGKFVVHG